MINDVIVSRILVSVKWLDCFCGNSYVCRIVFVVLRNSGILKLFIVYFGGSILLK